MTFANLMNLSPKGVLFIARFEGFRARPYNDAAVPPNATVGYGHMIHPGPVKVADRIRYAAGMSNQQALNLLSVDCMAARNAVRQAVTSRISQGMFDALVSFTFNCGPQALRESTLLRKVNAQAPALEIEAEFLKWVHAGAVVLPGLIIRRKAEARLANLGVYS